MQGPAYPPEKTLSMVFTQVESLLQTASQRQPPIQLKPAELQRSLDLHAKSINEFRFYKELLTSLWSPKAVSQLMTVRKNALVLKKLSNHPGLQMDKVVLGMDDWSGLVVRILSNHSNANAILVQFQANLEKLSKENSALKSMKENITRVTLTTVIECLIISLNKQTKYFDDSGKHVLEERINFTGSPERPKLTASHLKKENQNPFENSAKSISKSSPPDSPLKMANAIVSPPPKIARQSSKEHLKLAKTDKREADPLDALADKRYD